MRLDPYYPFTYLELLGSVYFQMGEYEEMVKAFNMLVVREPHSIVGHEGLAVAYIRLGRKEQVRSEVAEVLKLFPEYSLEVYRKHAHLNIPGTGQVLFHAQFYQDFFEKSGMFNTHSANKGQGSL